MQFLFARQLHFFSLDRLHKMEAASNQEAPDSDSSFSDVVGPGKAFKRREPPKTRKSRAERKDNKVKADLIKIRLATEVEARGGLDCVGKGKQFLLSDILRADPFFKDYHKKCENHLHYWQNKWTPLKYRTFLLNSGIVPATDLTDRQRSRVRFDLEPEARPPSPEPFDMPTTGGPRANRAAAAPAAAPAAVGGRAAGPPKQDIHTGMLLALCGVRVLLRI
jgi:hypothetical protein